LAHGVAHGRIRAAIAWHPKKMRQLAKNRRSTRARVKRARAVTPGVREAETKALAHSSQAGGEGKKVLVLTASIRTTSICRPQPADCT